MSEAAVKDKRDTGVRRWFCGSEGSVRGWLVVVASFLCNGIIFGIINSAGVIVKDLVERLKEQGDEDATAKASLVGSLAIGMTFFTSATAGVLTDQLGIRMTALVGSLLATFGMTASYFFCNSIYALYFTFSVLFGVGASLVYTPSLVILGHYFRRYLGVVNGFVTSGSPVFTLVMPHIMSAIIGAVKLEGLFLVLAVLNAVLIGCVLLFKPVETTENAKKRSSAAKKRVQCNKIINCALFSRRRYLIWCVAMPVAFLGYFVFYIHTAQFIQKTYIGHDGNILLSCVAIMSLISRLICGPLADHPKVNVVTFQQISFALLGLLTMLLVSGADWWLMIVLALGMGVCDGVSVTLIGPIAFELCGKEGASQAIGFVLAICSIPMTVGPTIGGFLYDKSNSYTLAYLLSGALTIFGAAIMFLMHCVQKSVPEIPSVPEPIEFEVMTPLCKEPPAVVVDSRPAPPSYKEATQGNTTSEPT